MTDHATVINYLDSYCERAGDAAFFAEPLNFFTNFFFIVAALACARLLLTTPKQGPRTDLWLMVLFLFSIGIGSGLWHLRPSPTTVLLDVIPITLFINAYILSALRRLFGLPWPKVAMWWVIYFASGMVAQVTLPPNLLNGTIMYIPTYLALGVMTLGMLKRDPAVGRVFKLAISVWTLSLLFRTVDRDVCPTLTVGTHFLWHTLNAWVLWRLLKVLMVHPAHK